MTSKKLGALLRSVPPATAIVEDAPEPEPRVTEQVPPPPTAPILANKPTAGKARSAGQGRAAPVPEPEMPQREVPLQVLIPAGIRRQLALHCAEQGESLRSVMLQAIRALGIEVSDADIAGKRGRKNY